MDAAQHILDNIRVTTGCAAAAPRQTSLVSRVELAAKSAHRAIKERQCRIRLIGHQDIHGDPAWDILLNLFVRQVEERFLTPEAVAANCFAPESTASRWLKVLEHKGLVRRIPDRADRKRQVVGLTSAGFEEMLRYFETIAGLDANQYDRIDEHDWGQADNNFQ